ncbi:MAG: DMT family transporter [Lachnospiraceae bacterium]|nr:DMT family transporter [Lachnospiraceae bacterium]
MNNRKTIRYAILAALLYAISTPFSKLLMNKIPPVFMAGFLYLGAAIGMSFIVMFLHKKNPGCTSFTRDDIPYLIGIVVLDIAAPILLMIALDNSSAESVSLLNNFEIVTTSLIAFIIFKENISLRLWGAIILITVAGILLSLSDISSLTFSSYSLMALLACCCWGLENNCTRKLSHNDPAKIVIIKGFGSGTGALIIAFISGIRLRITPYILLALILGFIAYGLSIYTYVYAQRYIGAARTSAFYALSPFVGSVISLIIFPKIPSFLFVTAFIIMAAGSCLATEK